MYNLIPYNSKNINNDITVELFEIQEKDEWIFLDIYK
jgi:hypothetical protein